LPQADERVQQFGGMENGKIQGSRRTYPEQEDMHEMQCKECSGCQQMQEMRLQGSETKGKDVPRSLNTTSSSYFFPRPT